MNVVIYGAGGHGRVVLDILQQAEGLVVAGFLDDDTRLHGASVAGLPVIGDMSHVVELRTNGISGVVVAIGNNRDRRAAAARLEHSGLVLVNAIHPTATVARSTRLGKGVMICAGAVVNPDAAIGDDTIINSGVIVEHDNVIEDHVHLAPGTALAGSVRIGAGAFLGLRAVVLPGISVGSWSVVAAGSVVTSDLPDQVIAGGSPAKVLRANSAPPDLSRVE